MTKAYRDIMQLAKNRHVSLRTAAFILALRRVAKATVMRGKHLPRGTLNGVNRSP